jgi:hypothetical protein
MGISPKYPMHPGRQTRAKEGEVPKIIRQHKKMDPVRVPTSLGTFLDPFQIKTVAEPDGETSRRNSRERKGDLT